MRKTLPKPKRMYVYCTTQFEHLHRYGDAPSNVSYLRNLHRHLFHVKVTMPVKHDDREVEFIGLKHNVDSILSGVISQNMSCEMIAQFIGNKIHELSSLKVASVEVSEDGENGAIVNYE